MGGGRKARQRFQPSLEALEDRCLLANYNVSSLADNLTENTVRKAITDLNATGGASNDITFNGCPSGTISLVIELPAINKNVDILGPGRNYLTVTRGVTARFGILAINAGVTARISALTISNGNAIQGGGIVNRGTSLTVRDASITNNTAYVGDGIAKGGGIANLNGALTVQNTMVTSNTSTGVGGGLFCDENATLTVSNSTISGNTADLGAGIHNRRGTVTVQQATTISGNTATWTGGGIHNAPAAPGQNGRVTVSQSTISGNFAGTATSLFGHGGGISNASTLDNGLFVEDSVIDGNQALGDPQRDTGWGGGIFNEGRATITATVNNRTTLSGNRARKAGGAIFNRSTPDTRMTVRQVELNNNRVLLTGYGSGIFNAALGGPTEYGLVVSHTAVTRNQFEQRGWGAIYNASFASVDISNSNFSRNISTSGGAIYAAPFSIIRSINNDIPQNQAMADGGGPGPGGEPDGVGGGVYVAADATFTTANTIFAGNTASLSPDFAGTAASLGHNLVADVSGSSGFSEAYGDLLGVDPLLSELGYYGGPTETHLLLPGSPALDAGDTALAPLPTDQRGYARVVGMAVDIGAVEMEGSELSSPTLLALRPIRVSLRRR